MSGAVIGEAQNGWTGRRVALLVDHYRAGLSAANSAALIGGVSKNAVVSKRRRLGLLATVGVGERSADDTSKPRPAVGVRLRPFRGPPPLPVEPLPEMDGALPPEADPRPLTARRFGECAWPLGPAESPGDYRTLFCSAPTVAGGGYCPTHVARAYRRRPS
jgi:GcrA cell cycle regulator